MTRGARAAAVAAAAVAWAPAAGAQLHEAAERVARAWRGQGAVVVVDRTRFLNDDEVVPLLLPPLSEGECTTVALLGARGLGFYATLGDAAPSAGPSDRLVSEAGALSIERCGARLPRRILLTAESGRGAIETVVARSAKALEPLRAILPERGGGGAAVPIEPGSLPPLPPPARRAEIAEARARLDGAVIAPRQVWRAGADGAGTGEETLPPGCHTIELIAPDPRAADPRLHAKLDLDAEMRDGSGDRVLARDRTDAPDAQLSACLGESTPVAVAFIGSPPGAPVLVAHFAWPVPARVPSLWGAEAVARMAHVLSTRHATSLPRAPIALVQGGSGATPVPLPIEPGGCYLALLAITQGAARSITLRARVGLRETYDDRGPDEDGAVLAFCAGSGDRALVEVDARGTPLLGWGLALYRVQGGVWEAAP